MSDDTLQVAAENIPEQYEEVVTTSPADDSDQNSTADTHNPDEGEDGAAPPVLLPVDVVDKQRSRKRQRDPSSWKSNIRKRPRESGEEYVNRFGKTNVAKGVKGTCREKCRLKCPQHISIEERLAIHESFWKLSDNKKFHFYSKYIDRNSKSRTRTLNDESRRAFSLQYNFHVKDKRIHVCKEYFLKTLDISQRRIDYFFKNVNNEHTNVPRSPLKGKNTKSHIPEDKKEQIRDHIKSFPAVESHYCRAETNRTFLESTLNINEMYRLYQESVEYPLKKSMYSSIFNNEFNISFHHLKKDRCDHCEEVKAQGDNVSNDLQEYYTNHIAKKTSCKAERDRDRALYGPDSDGKTAVISFDLENVFSLPRAEISNFFYKRKLNSYNLTAHCSLDKKAYNALWHECISGRGANHIASALIKILKLIMEDHPEVEKLILWSDACVPQNRNSIMSLALIKFISEMDHLIEIEQKLSEPGHGNIQEVDNVHSRIEKWLVSREVYSPPALLRALNLLGRRNNMQFVQMHDKDFLNYQGVSSKIAFNQVPYTKVKNLQYHRNTMGIMKYRVNFSDADNIVTVRLWRAKSSRQSGSDQVIDRIPNIALIGIKPSLSDEKKKDIKSMYRYMSDEDKSFYNTLM